MTGILTLIALAVLRPRREVFAALAGFSAALIILAIAPGTAARSAMLGPRSTLLVAADSALNYLTSDGLIRLVANWPFELLVLLVAGATVRPLQVRSAVILIALALSLLVCLSFPVFWIAGYYIPPRVQTAMTAGVIAAAFGLGSIAGRWQPRAVRIVAVVVLVGCMSFGALQSAMQARLMQINAARWDADPPSSEFWKLAWLTDPDTDWIASMYQDWRNLNPPTSGQKTP